MAAQTQIPIEEYLHSGLPSDHEYLDGEIVERNVGQYRHGKAQRRLAALFDAAGKKLPLYAATEIHVRVAPRRIRIADVAVFAGEEPIEEIPSKPPLIAIEILSPEDLYRRILDRFEDYRAWGVRHIWFVDPWHRTLHVYESGTLRQVSSFEIPEYSVEIPAAEIFE